MNLQQYSQRSHGNQMLYDNGPLQPPPRPMAPNPAIATQPGSYQFTQPQQPQQQRPVRLPPMQQQGYQSSYQFGQPQGGMGGYPQQPQMRPTFGPQQSMGYGGGIRLRRKGGVAVPMLGGGMGGGYQFPDFDQQYQQQYSSQPQLRMGGGPRYTPFSY